MVPVPLGEATGAAHRTMVERLRRGLVLEVVLAYLEVDSEMAALDLGRAVVAVCTIQPVVGQAAGATLRLLVQAPLVVFDLVRQLRVLVSEAMQAPVSAAARALIVAWALASAPLGLVQVLVLQVLELGLEVELLNRLVMEGLDAIAFNFN